MGGIENINENTTINFPELVGGEYAKLASILSSDIGIGNNSFTIPGSQKEENIKNVEEENLIINNYYLEKGLKINTSLGNNRNIDIIYSTDKTYSTFNNKSEKGDGTSSNINKIKSKQIFSSENLNNNLIINEEIFSQKNTDKTNNSTIITEGYKLGAENITHNSNGIFYENGHNKIEYSNTKTNNNGENTTEKNINYEVNQVVGMNSGNLNTYVGIDGNGKKQKIKGQEEINNGTKNITTKVGANYIFQNGFYRDSKGNVVSNESILSAEVSKTKDEDNTSKSTIISYDSKNLDLARKEIKSRNNVTGDKTTTTTYQGQYISDNINPDSNIIDKDGVYYKIDGKKENIKEIFLENGNSHNNTISGSTMVGYHNNDAKIDVSLEKTFYKNKTKNSQLETSQKTNSTKLKIVKNTFLGKISADITKKTDNLGENNIIKTTEKNIKLEAENITASTQIIDSNDGTYTRNSTINLSKNLEGEISENGNQTYAEINGNISQNIDISNGTNSKNNVIKNNGKLGVKNENKNSNYYLTYNNDINETSNNNEKTSDIKTSFGLGTDVNFLSGIDGTAYIEHKTQTQKNNGEKLNSQTNSLNASLKITEPEYKIPEGMEEDPLAIKIQEQHTKNSVSNILSGNISSTNGDENLNPNGKEYGIKYEYKKGDDTLGIEYKKKDLSSNEDTDDKNYVGINFEHNF